MMNRDWDPYDALIDLSERMSRLENAHNKMAHAFQQTENELTIALHSLRNLQQKYLLLLKRVEDQDQINKLSGVSSPGS